MGNIPAQADFAQKRARSGPEKYQNLRDSENAQERTETQKTHRSDQNAQIIAKIPKIPDRKLNRNDAKKIKFVDKNHKKNAHITR